MVFLERKALNDKTVSGSLEKGEASWDMLKKKETGEQGPAPHRR